MNENNKMNVGFEPETNKKYQGQEYQLIFEVLGKRRDTSTGGDWAGKPFYRLKVKVEKPEEFLHISEVLAFQEKIENKEIWNEIINDDYFDKRKLAICKKYKKTLNLVRWTDRPLGGGAEVG